MNMSYTGKTDWKYDDLVTEQDWNRIEAGIVDHETRITDNESRITDNEAHIANHESRIDAVETDLSDAPSAELTLTHGMQVVTAPRKSPFRMQSLRGRTFLNIISGGDCESISPSWSQYQVNLSLDNTWKNEGTYSIRATASQTSTTAGAQLNMGNTSTLVGSHLIAMKVKVSTSQSAHMLLNAGVILGRTLKTGEDGTLYAVVDNIPQNSRVGIRIASSEEGQYVNIDSLRIYRITSEEKAYINSLSDKDGQAYVDKNYPYIKGMCHVQNPYIQRYGENLLPPFSEWEGFTAFDVKYKIIDSHQAKITRDSIDNYYYYFKSPKIIVGNCNYTISSGIEISGLLGGKGAYLQILYYDKYDELIVPNQEMFFTESGREVLVTTPPVNASYMHGVLGIDRESTGTVKFSNPILNVGYQPLPFVPSEDSLLVFPNVTLCSNGDGTLYDEIYEQDGRFYKRAQFKALDLDGALDWKLQWGLSPGNKLLRIDIRGLSFIPNTDLSKWFKATKYDGTLLGYGQGVDQLDHDSSDGLYISVSNADSGWGDDYTPTSDEIKAYFYGWKMYDTSNADASNIYNRTDGLGKGWVYRLVDVLWGPAVTNVPTTQAPINSKWQPYKLRYQLATPIMEEVQSVGEVTLLEGQNQIEVGCGMILREKANPLFHPPGNAWFINNVVEGWESTRFKYKAKKILNIYKDSNIDTQKWFIEAILGYGNERGYINNSNYDPTAVYTVDYIAFRPFASIPQIAGSYGTTLKNVVDRLVDREAQLAERVGVLESAKADKYPAPPQWIAPTLLNGWVNFGGTTAPIAYFKDELGFVHITGTIKDGKIGYDPVFILPEGYRVKATINVPIFTSKGSNTITGAVEIIRSGGLRVWSGLNGFVDLSAIPPFLAEN
ncbi:hypothetical protein PAE9249_04967 [Paenibacillus sp. CECT 9249]|uniref:hypothetical protein n=1 Tax=Paenibacillus sp. CECT 9249 TaxID=2845385 RepID=UPI001E44937E|nr:hypothetical protein [Paenibacillus sp. CECT 9249]CAH0122417.1 hypothetical protein PAE9249_04967 [Paenibacillus sp. CECT 9249]